MLSQNHLQHLVLLLPMLELNHLILFYNLNNINILLKKFLNYILFYIHTQRRLSCIFYIYIISICFLPSPIKYVVRNFESNLAINGKKVTDEAQSTIAKPNTHKNR
jgi:hypothetical protein